MRNVFARLFAAEVGRRENFCGIREIEGIEGAADALHGAQIGLAKHFGHHALFVFADTVFAGDGTASGETDFENFVGERLRGFGLAFDVAVVED